MRLVEIRDLDGPNIFLLQPAIKVEFALSPGDLSAAALAGLSARLEPLVPTDDERDGYVPNVVYSCGSMIHGNDLILPFGFSDMASRIAKVPLDTLLTTLAG